MIVLGHGARGSFTLTVQAESYRLKLKRKAGLLGRQEKQGN